MSIVVRGRCGIRAEVVQDSIDIHGDARITTFLLDYPRFVHAEMMTHRVFSRNAASSRAIPVNAIIEAILAEAAEPVWWGKNQPGMQAKEELDGSTRERAHRVWHSAKGEAIKHALEMHGLGVHKQIVNRLLEPFQIYRALFTATELKNFFALRCHPDAQPEVRELAECAYRAYTASTPTALMSHEWHVPFVDRRDDGFGGIAYYDDAGDRLSLEDAIKVSASCAAQTSYRKSDPSLDKAQTIYDRLVTSKPVHASPFEHQARPMSDGLPDELATHVDLKGRVWSGNFRGWGQNRQAIEGNVVEG